MEINGRTRICGLLGYPVAHTLSPLIHNTLAEELGQNLVYVPFPVKPDQIGEAVRGAYALDVTGLNVTVPHKSAVLPWLKEIDPLAEKVGAVNTLVRCPGGYKGYNTDLTGLQRAMESDGIHLKGEKVILLGAGGAARAAAFLCAHAGAAQVWLLNRTPERAQQLANEVNTGFDRNCIHALTMADYRQIPDGSYLAIQGTSVGLYPDTEDVVICEPGLYKMIHTGYDLIYRPFDTRFMQLVRAQGGRAYNGLKMLAYQAIGAWELWNNTEVSQAAADHIIRKLKEETKTDE